MDLEERFSFQGPDENGYPLTSLIHAHECVGDFWSTLQEALVQAGGDPELAEFGSSMSLKMFADCVAPNGLRMVYFPEATMDDSRKVTSS